MTEIFQKCLTKHDIEIAHKQNNESKIKFNKLQPTRGMKEQNNMVHKIKRIKCEEKLYGRSEQYSHKLVKEQQPSVKNDKPHTSGLATHALKHRHFCNFSSKMLAS